MKQKKTIITIVILLLGLGLHAQKNVLSTGGEATGAGGNVSFSVGQVVYTSNTGTNGNIIQGVQQPFEITVLSINEPTVEMELLVYPNPTTNYLTLSVKETENLQYQLFDLQGKIISTKKITSTNSKILMSNLPTATYFLKVTKNNQVIKTFKIIKN